MLAVANAMVVAPRANQAATVMIVPTAVAPAPMIVAVAAPVIMVVPVMVCVIAAAVVIVGLGDGGGTGDQGQGHGPCEQLGHSGLQWARRCAGADRLIEQA